MKAGTYWTLGPDGWVLFEVRAWGDRLDAWSFGWPAVEPLHVVQRTHTDWRRVEPPESEGRLH